CALPIYPLLDRGLALDLAVLRLRPASEEVLERERAARGLRVLAGHRPADGRDVDADLVGDLLHPQRVQRADALVEEVLLVLEDLVGDPLERALPLLDR